LTASQALFNFLSSSPIVDGARGYAGRRGGRDIEFLEAS